MLTLLWLVPAIGALLVVSPLLIGRPAGPGFGRTVALVFSLVTLSLSIAVAARFDAGHHGYQFEEYAAWIPQYSVGYHLGIDGISLWLVVLNCLLTVIAVLAGGRRMARMAPFLALILLLEAAMNGVFLAADLLLFYVYWEAMLIPAYFLLWVWGEGPRPGFAATKFVLYTLAGSLLMLVGVIGEYVYAGASTHSFDMARLAAHPPTPEIQFGLFLLFGLAFAVKIPLFPFHSWLPDAYGAAPVAFLITFAGVMGKTGAYAMLRIMIPLLPHPSYWWDWNGVMPILAVLSIAWGALMALAQRDMKLLVAYSSLSHMGFIVLGIFAFNQQGQQGAVIQMVNHGVIVPALFLLVAWIAARTGTRDRAALRDLAPTMPVLAGVFLVVTLAALGLPGLNSFVGEFLTLLGAWQYAPWLAVAGCIGLVLAPVYMLRLFQGTMYVGADPAPARTAAPAGRGAAGRAGARTRAGTTAALTRPRVDISASELALLLPLLLLMFLLGLDPYLITHPMTALGFALPAGWR